MCIPEMIRETTEEIIWTGLTRLGGSSLRFDKCDEQDYKQAEGRRYPRISDTNKE
jgi:hypothetical protein